MRKIIVPILVLAAVGCDATRRDFDYCDSTHGCKWGFSCDQTEGLCKAGDAGVKEPTPDAPLVSDGGPDVTTDAVDATLDGVRDLPIVDGTVADQPIVDANIVDVGPPMDAATPDTRVPDAQGSCSVDNDCIGASGGAFCVRARCVACKTSSNCNNDAGVPFCSAENTCVSCAGGTGADGGVGCPAATPVCNGSTGSCVECTRNPECKIAGKAFCSQSKCVGCDDPGARSSTGGTDAGIRDGGGSDGGTSSTVACTGSKPVCVPSNSTTAVAGQCVGCLTNTDCGGSTPICNSSNVCVPCTDDSQCTTGPGVCMAHQDGRCATDAETIYVRNSSGCTGGNGTSPSPYCLPQTAMGVLSSSSKRLIVIVGGTALATWSTPSNLGSQQISVIGQQQPMISAGAADTGIHIASGNFYLRGLKVQGASSSSVTPSMPGVVVDAGATLAMDRCSVVGFAGGLVVNPGANFDIANSVFAANASGQFGTTTFFGGVYLGGSAPRTGPNRFWFNTVVGNADRGIICFDASQTLSGVLASGNAGGDYATCGMDKTSVWSSGRTAPDATSSYIGDLTLDSSYHLTATNHCRDLVDATAAHPADDLDGQARPRGAKLDCGADEY